MLGMKKDGLSCRECASNRYEEFHAQQEKKDRTSCWACKSALRSNFMCRMNLRYTKRALKYCGLV